MKISSIESEESGTVSMHVICDPSIPPLRSIWHFLCHNQGVKPLECVPVCLRFESHVSYLTD